MKANTMTDGYCKLASGIILSTVWREADSTRILWVTMLALKDRNHIVHASVPGLAAVANLPVDAVREGLARLMQPDADSRTKDHEGRRIEEVDGGWFILNGEKYRNYMSKAERNEYQAKLMAERRGRIKMLAPVSTKLAALGHTDTDTDTDTKAEAPIQRPAGYVVPVCFESVMGFSAALAGWIESRKKMRKPATSRAIQLVIDRCAERPASAVAALNEAVERGWQSFKWEWIDNDKRGGKHTPAPAPPKPDPAGWADWITAHSGKYKPFAHSFALERAEFAKSAQPEAQP